MNTEMTQEDVVERRCLRPECTEKFQCASNSQQRYCHAHKVSTLSVAMATKPEKIAKPSEDVRPKEDQEKARMMRKHFCERANELRAQGKSDAYIAEQLRVEGITGQGGKPPTTKSVYMYFYCQDKKNERLAYKDESRAANGLPPAAKQETLPMSNLNNIENATECSKIIRNHNEKVLQAEELEPIVKATNAPPLVRSILFATELSAEKRIAMLVAYFEPEE